MSQRLLQAASRRAAANGTAAVQELFALGFERERYWTMLAHDLGVDHLRDLAGATMVSDAGPLTTEAVRPASSALVRMGGSSVLVLAPQPDEIPLLRRHLAETPALAERLRIAAPETIRAFIVQQRHMVLTRYAVSRLARVIPRLSVRSLWSFGSPSRPTALIAAALALGLLAPITAAKALGFLFTALFVNCSLWKAAAAFGRFRPLRVEPTLTARLPSYTVLVPLYREAAVLPDLVKHLRTLDYPVAKLQILIILEAEDWESRAAASRCASSIPFEILVVPPGGPRTKPKALTYALPFARGEFVVVFDAEDRPEPDQLCRAAAAFRDWPELGCAQARLAPDNEDSWLARMFAVEYAANFEVLLPALAAWGMPLPLGGTSNHFPRAVLEKVGGWDPYNVTEDADLGIRLARFGYRSATIASRTFEEAPVRFRQWLPQRRRWIKGWIQTAALCLGTDIPKSLRLPLRSQLVIHGILTAGVLGLLFYPASLMVAAGAFFALVSGHWPAHSMIGALLALNVGNLLVIIAIAAVAAVRGLIASRAPHLVLHVFGLPLYWALMSLAAWQALFQFLRRPSLWEKTLHGVARRRPIRRRAGRL